MSYSASIYDFSKRRQRKRRPERAWRTRKRVSLALMAMFLLAPSCCHTEHFTGVVVVADESAGDGNNSTLLAWELQEERKETSKNATKSSSASPLSSTKKKETVHLPVHHHDHHHDHPSRTMEEELQLHAEQQHKSKERIQKERSYNQKEQEVYLQFMEWCQNVLGIQTNLEIHTFYYYDYMTAIMTNPATTDDDFDDDDDDNLDLSSKHSTSNSNTNDNPKHQQDDWQDPPMIPVRGLRATRNITQGEVIISIPFQALLTVSTTIDQDPVLSRVMGPKARKAYGWTLEQDNTGNTVDSNNNNADTVDFFELPLLAMALLHHYKLGTSSPMYPYIHILKKSPLDSMPFLWDREKRRKQYATTATGSASSSVTKGIQTVARSIRLEMKDMYHAVVDVLVLNHPELFGRRDDISADDPLHHQYYDVLDDEEWAFSFENFQWAFAMVNSRHWLLPISDLEKDNEGAPAEAPQPPSPMMMQPQGSVDGVPPAEMPTDAWVGQRELDDEEADQQEEETTQQHTTDTAADVKPKATSYHSFLAPVADLLNFGPPCTRGRYNQETRTFDIIASCDFIPGQEVTFWYSDECEEIMIGNYGFSHPMVPKCPTAENYRLARDKWKQRATSLQEALEDAYEDMDVIDTELQHLQQVLANCDCCDKRPRQQQQQQQEQGQYPPPPQQQPPQLQQQPIGPPQQKNEPPITASKPAFQQLGHIVDDSLLQGGRNLRNPDPAPSQIRGGGGGRGGARGNHRMSRNLGDNNSNNNANARPRSSPDGSTSSRSRGASGHHQSRSGDVDDDVQRHGVRRMWAGRSAL